MHYLCRLQVSGQRIIAIQHKDDIPEIIHLMCMNDVFSPYSFSCTFSTSYSQPNLTSHGVVAQWEGCYTKSTGSDLQSCQRLETYRDCLLKITGKLLRVLCLVDPNFDIGNIRYIGGPSLCVNWYTCRTLTSLYVGIALQEEKPYLIIVYQKLGNYCKIIMLHVLLNIFLVLYEHRFGRRRHLLRLFTNQFLPIFWYLHKNRRVAHSSYVPSIGRSDNRKKLSNEHDGWRTTCNWLAFSK